MMTRRCTSCKEPKPITAFYMQASGRPKGTCRECRNEKARDRKRLRNLPPPSREYRDDEQDDTIRKEAHRRALLLLVERHKSEYESLYVAMKTSVREDL